MKIYKALLPRPYNILIDISQMRVAKIRRHMIRSSLKPSHEGACFLLKIESVK